MNKRNFWLLGAIVILFGILVSCGDDEPVRNINEDQLIEDLLEQDSLLDSTSRDASGIYFRILTENPSGATPTASDVLSFFFTAQMGNGPVFEANENNGTNLPSRTHYAENSVVPVGLDNCLGLLREGETGIFYIPPSLAYGGFEGFNPAIPQDSVLQITIELVDIQSPAELLALQRDSIDQFILDHNLDDSVYAPIDTVMILNEIWASIDSVMTPIDSMWIPNMNLTTDSVMVPFDSIWYPVMDGEIEVDSVFLYNEYEWIDNMNLTADSVMIPVDSIWYPVIGGAIEIDSVFDFVDYVEYLPAQRIYYQRLDSGDAGTGVIPGDLVSIRYQLYTLESFPNNPIDGTGAGTFQFFHFDDVVIFGLDGGVSQMEINERALLIMPSEQAYQGSVFVMPESEKQFFVDIEVIPSYTLTVDPFEVLVFELTLLPN